jgi:hypothetical protein
VSPVSPGGEADFLHAELSGLTHEQLRDSPAVHRAIYAQLASRAALRVSKMARAAGLNPAEAASASPSPASVRPSTSTSVDGPPRQAPKAQLEVELGVHPLASESQPSSPSLFRRSGRDSPTIRRTSSTPGAPKSPMLQRASSFGVAAMADALDQACHNLDTGIGNPSSGAVGVSPTEGSSSPGSPRSRFRRSLTRQPSALATMAYTASTEHHQAGQGPRDGTSRG